MPLYEYQCNKCDNFFETLVTHADEVVKCKKCNTEDIRKIFSVFGLNNNHSGYSSDREIAADNASCCCNKGCGCN